MNATTRTLNPLPFQDLEPHRFEDLVRQLAYEFREWSRLEATGRGGADDGFDIRAVERVPDGRTLDDDEDEQGDEPNPLVERVWAFQCKREKALGPKRMQEVIESTFAPMVEAPHGFVLAVACDLSKKTRDAFRSDMQKRGIEEFALWAKGELEDMLFQPRHDGLLFAYFGISLQPRRRSLVTSLRSEIAKKKQLAKLLGEDEDHDDGYSSRLVLLRDPTDDSYPHETTAHGRWLACHPMGLKHPGHLVVRRRKHLAALNDDHSGWDALETHDLERQHIENELRSRNAWGVDDDDDRAAPYHAFWNEYIRDGCRAFLEVYGMVPLERVLAIDPLGDGYFPVPHILVEFDRLEGPFAGPEIRALSGADAYGDPVRLRPDDTNRVVIFPAEFPGELEPPPKGFDDTLEAAAPLTSTSDARLLDLLAQISERRAVRSLPRPEPDRDKEASEPLRSFDDWRETIARPVLSAFVARLRAAGHGATILVRSLERSASIELKVKVRTSNVYNSDYVATGRVAVLISAGDGWALEVYPPSEEPSRKALSRRPNDVAPPSAPKARAYSQTELEEVVLRMLERLGT